MQVTAREAPAEVAVGPPPEQPRGAQPPPPEQASGLPTAQNVFVFASRFQQAPHLARDAVVLSTVASAVTLVLVAVTLG